MNLYGGTPKAPGDGDEPMKYDTPTMANIHKSPIGGGNILNRGNHLSAVTSGMLFSPSAVLF